MYFIIIIPILALLAWIIFRKKSNVETSQFQKLDKSLQKLLSSQVNYYYNLSRDQKKRFESQVAAFLHKVNLEGVGTEITDLDRVLIASSAVIPVFGLGDWEYSNLTNVILYPDAFDHAYQFEGNGRNIQGMVGTGYMNGQMILSRPSLLKGFSSASGKENTAIHEFVHLVDKSDGATDGIPEQLTGKEYADPWLKLMHQEMRRIRDGKSDINPYAMTSEAEFLAVAAEYFFEKPDQFKDKHPELYQQLSEIFRQRPVKGTGFTI
ncbi:zinc-dependent peptidase [Mucilaginibacter sp. UR6-11]|uniref:M90 family metallopeptidase n=1 Tax=Mucilaginibacter sp. UR6-11 TaxID=1435644 RepID=UPI001E2F8699|nr:M90 family metallopeptidase [Mucilaginibacter sp. UR6-11]MCC8424640.1 zinc-dependent peptidase [Mucilaginibacter sp. UR6-11]